MKVIKNFQHKVGFHCGSTALADVAGLHGHDLSEAMCFGLGEGLGFMFYKSKKISPSRLFNGRSVSLESFFFNNMGIDFQWKQGDAFPWTEMKEWIDKDVPVLILTDLFYLDYYKTNTHFTGHAILLAGYDEEKGEALIADTGYPGLQRTSLDSLSMAMKSSAPPFPVKNYWTQAEYYQIPNLPAAIHRALVNNSRTMLYPPPKPLLGIPAMEIFSQDLNTWNEAEDWQWCARYAYQVIERRGTGGSGFRLLYQMFLEEAENYLPGLRQIKASAKMRKIAETWSELAAVLKEISQSGPGKFPEAGILAAGVTTLEKDFFTKIITSEIM